MNRIGDANYSAQHFAGNDNMSDLRILETPEDLLRVEDLQRTVWPGNEIEIVPNQKIRLTTSVKPKIINIIRW